MEIGTRGFSPVAPSSHDPTVRFGTARAGRRGPSPATSGHAHVRTRARPGARTSGRAHVDSPRVPPHDRPRMTITVYGAGAIGGVTGAALAQAGHDVLLVDKAADHVAAVNAHGLAIDNAP